MDPNPAGTEIICKLESVSVIISDLGSDPGSDPDSDPDPQVLFPTEKYKGIKIVKEKNLFFKT